MKRFTLLASLLVSCRSPAPAASPTPTVDATTDAAAPSTVTSAAAPSEITEPAAPTSDVAEDYGAVLSGPRRAVESTVRNDETKEELGFRIMLPAPLKEIQQGILGTSIYAIPGVTVTLSADEPMSLKSQRHMAELSERTILSADETKDGFVIRAHTRVVVEIIMVKRSKGSAILCNATTYNAVHEKEKVLPLLEKICASLELR